MNKKIPDSLAYFVIIVTALISVGMILLRNNAKDNQPQKGITASGSPKNWEEVVLDPNYGNCEKYKKKLNEYGRVTEEDVNAAEIIDERMKVKGKICRLTVNAKYIASQRNKDDKMLKIIEDDGWSANMEIGADAPTGSYLGYWKKSSFLLYEWSFEPKVEGGWDSNFAEKRMRECNMPPGACFANDELKTVISLSFGDKRINDIGRGQVIPETDSNSSGCIAAGQVIPPGRGMKCCGGLVGMFGAKLPDGKCVCTEKDDTCGGAPICAPCGNGKCEADFGENDCVCPKDCK